MHRFLMPPGHAPGDVLELGPAEAHHALRVLRLTPGAKIQLSDGQGGLFDAEIESVNAPVVRVRIRTEAAGCEPPIRLTLYQGLPKFDKLELICQKATELGAARIVPVRTSRAVIKLTDAEGEKRAERMRKICAEAAKQCGRANLPEVHAPVSFAKALEMMGEEALMLMPWEEARGLNMARAASQAPASVGIFIGPEGGISGAEAGKAKAAGAVPITLGPRILRTETAAICSIAMAMQLWGDL